MSEIQTSETKVPDFDIDPTTGKVTQLHKDKCAGCPLCEGE